MSFSCENQNAHEQKHSYKQKTIVLNNNKVLWNYSIIYSGIKYVNKLRFYYSSRD